MSLIDDAKNVPVNKSAKVDVFDPQVLDLAIAYAMGEVSQKQAEVALTKYFGKTTKYVTLLYTLREAVHAGKLVKA